jgi:NitT/TauT family transport system substrate-binding protein
MTGAKPKYRPRFFRTHNMRAAVITAFLTLISFGLVDGTASAATPVRVGTTNTSSDVTFFIADKKGYFKQEGIEAVFIAFDSAAKMIAPLSANQLDVGGGSVSAGLYNAVVRKIDIKIVADKGSMPPNYGFMSLLVRKDLIDSGKFKSYKDLKGLKAGVSANGSGGSVILYEALKKGGLNAADVDQVFMGFPQMALALQNKAIDVGFMAEPSSTRAITNGAAVRFAGGDVIDPNHQLAVVLYGDGFIKKQPEVAKKFMRAYIRAARDYNDALKDGKLAGPNADEIITILTQSTDIKDAALYRVMVPNGCNPDGRVNEASLKRNLQVFREQGLIQGEVSVAQVVDHSFADAVLKELGPYVPKSRAR